MSSNSTSSLNTNNASPDVSQQIQQLIQLITITTQQAEQIQQRQDLRLDQLIHVVDQQTQSNEQFKLETTKKFAILEAQLKRSLDFNLQDSTSSSVANIQTRQPTPTPPLVVPPAPIIKNSMIPDIPMNIAPVIQATPIIQATKEVSRYIPTTEYKNNIYIQYLSKIVFDKTELENTIKIANDRMNIRSVRLEELGRLYTNSKTDEEKRVIDKETDILRQQSLKSHYTIKYARLLLNMSPTDENYLFCVQKLKYYSFDYRKSRILEKGIQMTNDERSELNWLESVLIRFDEIFNMINKNDDDDDNPISVDARNSLLSLNTNNYVVRIFDPEYFENKYVKDSYENTVIAPKDYAAILERPIVQPPTGIQAVPYQLIAQPYQEISYGTKAEVAEKNLKADSSYVPPPLNAQLITHDPSSVKNLKTLIPPAETASIHEIAANRAITNYNDYYNRVRAHYGSIYNDEWWTFDSNNIPTYVQEISLSFDKNSNNPKVGQEASRLLLKQIEVNKIFFNNALFKYAKKNHLSMIKRISETKPKLVITVDKDLLGKMIDNPDAVIALGRGEAIGHTSTTSRALRLIKNPTNTILDPTVPFNRSSITVASILRLKESMLLKLQKGEIDQAKYDREIGVLDTPELAALPLATRLSSHVRNTHYITNSRHNLDLEILPMEASNFTTEQRKSYIAKMESDNSEVLRNFKNLIIYALCVERNQDEKVHLQVDKPYIYGLKVKYSVIADNLVYERWLHVQSGSIHDMINGDLTILPSYLETRAEMERKNKPPSDVFGGAVDLFLHTDVFIIQRIDVYRSGGITSLSIQDFILQNKDAGDGKNLMNLTLEWGKLTTFVVAEKNMKKNICFPQLLLHFLKKYKLIPKDKNYPTNYLKFWEQEQPKTFIQQSMLTFQEAAEMTAKYLLRLIIHDRDGSVIFDTHSEPDRATLYTAKTLRVMFFMDHYFLVTHIFSEKERVNYPAPLLNMSSKDLENASRKYKKVLVTYDYETVFREEIGLEHQHTPYGLAYAIEDGEIKCDILEIPSTDIAANMISDLMALGPGNEFVCIAYNGASFDHLLLFEYLMRNGFYCIVPPRTRGKLHNFKFWLPSGPNKSEGSTLTVWDPCLFTASTLAEAAINFKIPYTKIPFDHSIPLAAYQENRFPQYIKENLPYLIEYNKRDVQLLREFTGILLTTLTTLIKFPKELILSRPTIASICYNVFTQSLDRSLRANVGRIIPKNATASQLKNISAERFKEAKDEEFRVNSMKPYGLPVRQLDDLVRRNLVGGRVEGKKGRWKMNMIMIDVVSLYPYIMRDGWFPVGAHTVVMSVEESYKLYLAGRIGIYHVAYDQTSMPGPALLPKLAKDHYEWVKHAGTAWLSSVMISALHRHGALINFVTPGEYSKGVHAIVWGGSHQIFKSYVTNLEDKKNEQDRLKEANDPKFNSSIRTMVKNMLNSLSGKMVQKNYTGVDHMFTSEAQFHHLMNNLVKNYTPTQIRNLNLHVDDIAEGVSVSAMTTTTTRGFICYNDPEAYPDNAKPSQVGKFIYDYARIYMYDNIFSKMEFYYTDTDSACIRVEDLSKINPELLPYIIDATGKKIKVRDKTFGDFEIEESKNGTFIFDELVVIAPKIYALYNKGKIVKYRVKGVRPDDSFINPTDITVKVGMDNIFYRATTEEERVECLTSYTVAEHTELFFDVLSKRFTEPTSKVIIYSWMMKKSIPNGSIVHKSYIKEV